jgi:hypothetical protein
MPTHATQMPPGEPKQEGRREDENLSALQWICRSVLQTAFPVFQNAEIDASFYPYIGLTHTIRRKGSGWRLRISDHCRHAPRPVLEAIVMILGSKIVHRRPPRKLLETYDMFRKDPGVEESVRERRRMRGRKQFAGLPGKHHSLAQIYEEVNSRFFNNQIEIQKIGWSLRKGWRRLGHYDPIHHTITLSPALDSSKVPEFVVRYIVYHEMLHAVFENTSSRATKRHHPPEFHRAERAFPDFPRAKKFLREFFGRRRRGIDD